MQRKNLRIVVLVPCHNEAIAIVDVINDFRQAIPSADIYVYDNNSTDETVSNAHTAGAIVRKETDQGKGAVVCRMFADVDADIYILVDGDGTYDATVAPELVDTLLSGPFDMVNVARRHVGKTAYRAGHVAGNRALTNLVALLFGRRTTDMLSGYKAFSRRFVKTFPAQSQGFEIETELMIHCLDLRLPVAEISAPYIERPEGSESKLQTFRDGWRILKLVGFLLTRERPLFFFNILAALLAVSALALGLPIVVEFYQTGLVPRLPTAVLSAGIMQASIISFFSGLILEAVTHGRRETKRLSYLAQPPLKMD